MVIISLQDTTLVYVCLNKSRLGGIFITVKGAYISDALLEMYLKAQYTNTHVYLVSFANPGQPVSTRSFWTFSNSLHILAAFAQHGEETGRRSIDVQMSVQFSRQLPSSLFESINNEKHAIQTIVIPSAGPLYTSTARAASSASSGDAISFCASSRAVRKTSSASSMRGISRCTTP